MGERVCSSAHIRAAAAVTVEARAEVEAEEEDAAEADGLEDCTASLPPSPSVSIALNHFWALSSFGLCPRRIRSISVNSSTLSEPSRSPPVANSKSKLFSRPCACAGVHTDTPGDARYRSTSVRQCRPKSVSA